MEAYVGGQLTFYPSLHENEKNSELVMPSRRKAKWGVREGEVRNLSQTVGKQIMRNWEYSASVLGKVREKNRGALVSLLEGRRKLRCG